MPKFGLSMEKGFITKWYKKEGDPVKEGDALFEAESEKITNDVPAPGDGFLKKIVVQEGEEQTVGEIIAYIAENEKELKAEIKEKQVKEIKQEPKEEIYEEKPEASADINKEESHLIKASPIAKKLAREHNIDLSSVKGSGPNGRVIEKDVLAVISGTVPSYAQTKEHTEELTPLRKTIAENLAKSYRESVLVTNMTEVDMSALFSFKENYKEKVSVTAILVKAVAEVLKTLPKFNVNFDGNVLKIFSAVNIGVAVNTEKGLMVPVVKGAGTLPLPKISRRVKEISDAARNGNVGPDDLSGSHFTITNLGMMRTDMFTPVLNKGEVAILGVGRTVKKPVVVDGNKITIQPMCWFSLSYDHRIIDGADAAQFLGELSSIIEDSSNLSILFKDLN